MVSEKDYTGDAVTIMDSRGTTRIYPKARVTIKLQGDQEFSQKVAVSEVVLEDVLLGRDVAIGVSLLDTFIRQVRKAMCEKMNREFAGAVVIRSQSKKNQKLLLSRSREG